MPRPIRLFILLLLLPARLLWADTAPTLQDAENAFLREEYAQAERLLTPFVEAGNSRAQTYLGLMYLAGQGVPRDFDRAYALFAQAAAQNEAGAQLAIGMMYLHGFGRTPDRALAEAWIEKAAGQGNATAIETLMQLRFAE